MSFPTRPLSGLSDSQYLPVAPPNSPPIHSHSSHVWDSTDSTPSTTPDLTSYSPPPEDPVLFFPIPNRDVQRVIAATHRLRPDSPDPRASLPVSPQPARSPELPSIVGSLSSEGSASL